MHYFRCVSKQGARNSKLVLRLFASFVLFAVAVSAQEMEPRAYSRAPVGTNYVFYTYAFQTGDILTDSSTPLRDVSVTLHSVSAGYGHTFNLFGRQGNI